MNGCDKIRLSPGTREGFGRSAVGTVKSNSAFRFGTGDNFLWPRAFQLLAICPNSLAVYPENREGSLLSAVETLDFSDPDPVAEVHRERTASGSSADRK